MTGAALLVSVAALVLWWPRPDVHRRVVAGADRAASARRRPDPAWGAALLPVGALLAAGVAVAVATAMVAWTVVALRRRSRRRAAAELRRDRLRRALAVMVAELSVGAPAVTACRAAAAEAEDPEVREALSRMAARAELGGDPAGAGPDSESADLDRLAAAWSASVRRGLPLADLLQSLRTDLGARAGHASRTHAGLAGPRATAAVLALLPLLGIGLGQAMGAEPLAVLFGGGLGGLLLVVGTGLAVAGVWWTARITDRVMT